MRVALTAALKPGSPGDRAYPPLALGYLSAAVKQALPRVDVRIMADEAAIVAFDPDVVGISSVTENFSLALALADRLSRQTSARIIAGGVHASALPAALGDRFHAAVIGEGEETLVDMLRHPDRWDALPGVAVRRHGHWGQRAPRPPMQDLDTLPPPDRPALLAAWPAPAEVHLVTSRGCPHHCSLCSSRRHWGSHRQLSAGRVVAELEEVLAAGGFASVRFFDDLFITDRERLRQIHDGVRARGLHERAVFSGYVRASDVDEEVCRLLRGMRFQVVNFGAESGSERVLRRLKGRSARVEDNQRLVDVCRRHGLLPSASFVIGVPGETAEDLEATAAFIERNADDLYDVQVFPLAPYPGTVWWRWALSRGLVSEHEPDWGRLGILLSDFAPGRSPYLNEAAMPLASFGAWVERFQELGHRIKPYPDRLRRLLT